MHKLKPYPFILLITALRLLWHLLSPVNMTGDESYYWMWGQNLDWGYYSKPPFIGWLYALIQETPLIPKTFIIKSVATLFSAGCLYYWYNTLLVVTRNNKVAFYGLTALALSPANLLFSCFLTIDSPLMFFWAGALYFLSLIHI